MRCFEINVTYRCNQRCKYCDRLRQHVDMQGDVDMGQIDTLCRMIVDEKWSIGTLKLSGGEPLLHPRIRDIVAAFVALPRQHVHRIRILTNGTTDKMDFGRSRVAYWESPIAKKRHSPVLLSPTDFLVRGRIGTHLPCPLIRKCGAAFDCYGFTPCPAAGAFGHGVGVNPYFPTLRLKGYTPVCTHCFLSLGRVVRTALVRMVLSGEIEHPSPAYVAGIAKLRENPTPFPRW